MRRACGQTLRARAIRTTATSARKGGLSNSSSTLRDEIGLDQGAQLRCDLRSRAEPFLESEACLLQEHAEAVDRAMTPRTGCSEQVGLERHVHDVVHDRRSLER